MPRHQFNKPPANLPQDTAGIFLEACDSSDMPVLKQLIAAHPGIVNLKDEGGIPALHRAVSWAQTETVDLLFENGADPSIKDPQGQTADILAARLGYDSIAKIIVAAENELRQKEAEGIRRKKEQEDLLRRQRDEMMTKGLECFQKGLETPLKAKPPARFRK